jgi:hypothetical protein
MQEQNDILKLLPSGIRFTEPEDVEKIYRDLRPEDRAECIASHGDPLECLQRGYENSKYCFTGSVNDKPYMIFGVGEVEEHEGAGVVWMLGTTAINAEARFHFLKRSRLCVENLLHKDFPLLFNCVDARNTVHIKWLKWLGFKFINLHLNYGVAKLPFYEFVRIK